MTPSFWKNRRVLLTGHTGFKGAWAAAILADCGAQVTGMSLAPATNPNLWALIKNRLKIDDKIVDLRDASAAAAVCKSVRPEIVLHMAAQAQVRNGYQDPVGTFESNVMGSVNLLQALRAAPDLSTVLIVTSDKVYSNPEQGAAFIEKSELGGSDPYSASKAAVELVVRSYAESYFNLNGISLATARGGNVIGGGDFSSDRLVPDVYRAAIAGSSTELRYPNAHRPWQHVLDCLLGYFLYVEHLTTQKVKGPFALNFGPPPESIVTVAQLAEAIGRRLGNGKTWRQAAGEFPPESKALSLDATRASQILGWQPRLDLEETVAWTAQWYASFAKGADAFDLVHEQINRFSDTKLGQRI